MLGPSLPRVLSHTHLTHARLLPHAPPPTRPLAQQLALQELDKSLSSFTKHSGAQLKQLQMQTMAIEAAEERHERQVFDMERKIIEAEEGVVNHMEKFHKAMQRTKRSTKE